MKKTFVTLLIVASLFLAVATVFAAPGETDPDVLKDLAKVRQATAKYRDVTVATAEGYLPTTHCVEEPGLGGMGLHYVNPTLARDPNINLTTPEILLYIPVDGKLKLVAVEYFFGIGRPDAPVPNPAPPSPILFGRVFNGPMLGHEPGMPPHYDLHVWVWQANPEDMFAQFNPNVSCE